MIARSLALALFAAAAVATTAAAADIPSRPTKISYLAGGSVYIDGGRADGYLEGDTLAVMRGGKPIARLRIAVATTHRASCDTLFVASELEVGDPVWWIGRSESAADSTATAAAPPPVAGADSTLAASPIVGMGSSAAHESSPLHGRIGARWIGVQDRGAASTGFNQPALDFRLDGSNLSGAPVDLAVDARSRRTTTTDASGNLSSEALTRVYRASLSLHDRAARFRLTVGRQMSPTLASVSLFDGALAEYSGPRWSAGLFSGVQPNPLDDRFSSEVLEHGGFVETHSRPLEATRWSAAIGGVTSTDSGQTNRDFLFAQTYVQAPKLSVTATQELDLNRGWKRAAGEAALTPTSTFLLLRYQVSRPFALTGGYDNRRSVRLFRDRLTPETEFDDRFREGGWLGASTEIGPHLRVDGDVRRRGGGSSERSDAWSSGIEVYRWRRWNPVLRARFAQFTNTSLSSQLTSLGLGVDPLPAAHLEASGGVRKSEDRIAGTTENVDWMSYDLDVALARRWLLTGSIERDHSDVDRLLQEYVALSWRF